MKRHKRASPGATHHRFIAAARLMRKPPTHRHVFRMFR